MKFNMRKIFIALVLSLVFTGCGCSGIVLEFNEKAGIDEIIIGEDINHYSNEAYNLSSIIPIDFDTISVNDILTFGGVEWKCDYCSKVRAEFVIEFVDKFAAKDFNKNLKEAFNNKYCKGDFLILQTYIEGHCLYLSVYNSKYINEQRELKREMHNNEINDLMNKI